VPRRKHYAPDALTEEVIALVEREFPTHFGTTEGWDLPVRLVDIEAEWQWVLKELLPVFGPYEDAMAAEEPDMFHSRMSAFVNISRLLPRRIVEDVLQAAETGTIPLASAEGFVRQLLGWREFMRHIHRVTDGFRNIDAQAEPAQKKRRAKAEPADVKEQAALPETGARPSALGAALPLPAVYWGAESGLRCVDTVVRQVWQEGWSHHITRLMVLSNFATLCGYSPRELTDWFWMAYIDAYDWVVEPNVLGMGTFGDGGITATKPYVSGAAYVNRMSNYCGACRFDPKRTTGEGACPFTALYWTFLERQEGVLGKNPRMSMPYATLHKKSVEDRTALRARAEACVAELGKAKYPAH
jgi:deoxyribodipyrimidine photolyase-related protein